MSKKSLIILIVSFIFIMNCEQKKEPEPLKLSGEFSEFVDHFEPISLPYQIDTSYYVKIKGPDGVRLEKIQERYYPFFKHKDKEAINYLTGDTTQYPYQHYFMGKITIDDHALGLLVYSVMDRQTLAPDESHEKIRLFGFDLSGHILGAEILGSYHQNYVDEYKTHVISFEYFTITEDTTVIKMKEFFGMDQQQRMTARQTDTIQYRFNEKFLKKVESIQ